MAVASSATLSESSRKWIWVMGILAYTNGGVIVTASQTGAPLLLETRYDWPPSEISTGLWVSSLSAVPVLLALIQLSHAANLIVLGTVALISTLLLLPARQLPQNGMAISMFVSSALIYCSVCSASSMSTSAA